MNHTYDFILMGATSFVGKITAKRFAVIQSQNQAEFRWALAGRSQAKLAELASAVTASFPDAEVDTLVVDATDEADMKALAARTGLVVTTVGPYDRFGEPLVKACAEAGTDYCDLTGEPQFVARMISRYEQQAKASGARIVHCCGFDSIPSDLGTWFLQHQAQQQFGERCSEVNLRVKAASGGMSGGTVASLMNIIRQAKRDNALRKQLLNPYALAPEKLPHQQRYVSKTTPDWATDQWLAPFIMAGINSKVVLRSAQLMPEHYPQPFFYNEATMTGKGGSGKRRAKLMSAILMGLTVSALVPPLGWLVEKLVLPKPGQGPSEEKQRSGFYVLNLYGKTKSGQTLAVKVKGDEDPGYGSTSKMLAQVTLALLSDVPNAQGGFWTPASLLAEPLLSRLPENAGVSFEVISP